MRTLGKIKFIMPFLILFSVIGLLWRGLFSVGHADPLVGEPLPHFELTSLFNPAETLSPNNLYGQVSLVNVWASWCSACRMEHAMLMKIKNVIPIYGINYKDEPADAKAWLHRNGNPYTMVGSDYNGDTAIDLGVYGTPETFVISPEGKIIYRQLGAIDENTWETVLYPLIMKYKNKS